MKIKSSQLNSVVYYLVQTFKEIINQLFFLGFNLYSICMPMRMCY